MGMEPVSNAEGSEVEDIEVALEAFEQIEPRTSPAPVLTEAEIESAGFVLPDEENLSHLAPGCFVLIRKDGVYCWAEVVTADGDTIGGRLHNELSASTCLVKHHTTETIYFPRERIIALGCERYCWC